MILKSPRKYKIPRVRFFMFVFTVSTTVLLSPLEIGILKKCTNDIYCHFTCSKGWVMLAAFMYSEEIGEESIDGETEKRSCQAPSMAFTETGSS